MSITVRSNQKVFTEEEVSGLTGICLDHLRNSGAQQASRLSWPHRAGSRRGRRRRWWPGREMALYKLRPDGCGSATAPVRTLSSLSGLPTAVSCGSSSRKRTIPLPVFALAAPCSYSKWIADCAGMLAGAMLVPARATPARKPASCYDVGSTVPASIGAIRAWSCRATSLRPAACTAAAPGGRRR